MNVAAAPGGRQASCKEIVTEMMESLGEKEMIKNDGKTVLRRGFQCRLCNKQIWALAKSGYSNYWSHLKTHYRTTEHIQAEYEERMRQKATRNDGDRMEVDNEAEERPSPRPPAQAAPRVRRPRQKAKKTGTEASRRESICAHLDFCIKHNRLFTFCENKHWRAFTKYEDVSAKTLEKVAGSVQENVKQKIKQEMNDAGHGAIIQNVWTFAPGYHYLALFASYVSEQETKIILLACSPLFYETDSDDANMSDDVELSNARDHDEIIQYVFNDYGIAPSTWIKCLVAEKSSVNERVASLLNVPLVACHYQLLSFEVGKMIEENQELKDMICNIRHVMKMVWHYIVENKSLRHKLADAAPLHNKRDWTGKYELLKTFVKLHPELEAAMTQEDKAIETTVNDLNALRGAPPERVKYFIRQFDEIDQAAQALLKEENNMLSDARFVFDVLLERIANAANKPDHALHGCTLGAKYIATDSSVLSDPIFASAIVKVQNNDTHLLTEDEHNVLSPLKIDRDTLSIEQLLLHRKRARLNKQQDATSAHYSDCQFVLASAAVDKDLWGSWGYHLQSTIFIDFNGNECPVKTETVETMIFLWYNGGYWNRGLVDALLRKDDSLVGAQ